MKKNFYFSTFFIFLILSLFAEESNYEKNDDFSEIISDYEEIENELDELEKIESEEIETDILSDFVSSKKKLWQELEKNNNCCKDCNKEIS